MILGSVAENVIRHSPVNVLVVKREKRIEDSIDGAKALKSSTGR